MSLGCVVLECFILKIATWVADLHYIKKKLLNEFWLQIRTEFPATSMMARGTLLPLCTMYLCEVAFPALMITKSKY